MPFEILYIIVFCEGCVNIPAVKFYRKFKIGKECTNLCRGERSSHHSSVYIFSDKNAGNISVYKKITRGMKRARGHFAQREKGLKRAPGGLKMTVALQSRYRKGGDLGFKNLLCKQCLFS